MLGFGPGLVILGLRVLCSWLCVYVFCCLWSFGTRGVLVKGSRARGSWVIEIYASGFLAFRVEGLGAAWQFEDRDPRRCIRNSMSPRNRDRDLGLANCNKSQHHCSSYLYHVLQRILYSASLGPDVAGFSGDLQGDVEDRMRTLILRTKDSYWNWQLARMYLQASELETPALGLRVYIGRYTFLNEEMTAAYQPKPLLEDCVLVFCAISGSGAGYRFCSLGKGSQGNPTRPIRDY